MQQNLLQIDPSPKWQPKIQISQNELKLTTYTPSGEISAEKM